MSRLEDCRDVARAWAAERPPHPAPMMTTFSLSGDEDCCSSSLFVVVKRAVGIRAIGLCCCGSCAVKACAAATQKMAMNEKETCIVMAGRKIERYEGKSEMYSNKIERYHNELCGVRPES